MSIVVFGLAQVKVTAVDKPIAPGQRLTAAAMPGYARPLRTVEVDGVQLAEDAPSIGIALESLDRGEGLVWVLVNPH